MNTAERVADIGSRLEPFVDDWLIESMRGVDLKLHPPERCETALAFDAPWEGSGSAYVTVFKDGERYRMYYRGSSADGARREVTCCAESDDGIHWHRPAYGACEFDGSRDNNIVWTEAGSHNFMPFRDANPRASEAERYKAIGGGYHGFVSPDGIHWKKVRDEKIIDPFAKCVGDGDWIGQAFWDAGQEHYVAYVRGWRGSDPIRFQHELPAEHDGTLYPLCHVPDAYRQVLRCTSSDFIDWTEPEFINFGGTPPEHFYTNAVTPYFRAPHVYLSFPKRFAPERKKVSEHDKDGVSDAVFLSSRDGHELRSTVHGGLHSSRPRPAELDAAEQHAGVGRRADRSGRDLHLLQRELRPSDGPYAPGQAADRRIRFRTCRLPGRRARDQAYRLSRRCPDPELRDLRGWQRAGRDSGR